MGRMNFLFQYMFTYIANLVNVLNAGLPSPLVTVANAASPYLVGAQGDQFIAAAAGAGADTVVNLPSAIGAGNRVIVKKTDANPHNISVVPNGTDTIDGVNAAVNISSQWGVLRLIDAAAGGWMTW